MAQKQTPDRPAARQKLRTSRLRRARYWLSRLTGTRLQKSQKLYMVDIAGHRFKRVVLRDSAQAARIEANLECYGDSERIPGLVIRYENEVWLDFIEGEVLASADEASVRAIADLFAELYAREPLRIDPAEGGWVSRLARNLQFLRRVGVIDADLHDTLVRDGVEGAPEQVWLGFDYTDPVLKNFVRAADGRICAIDVESLEPETLIGTGYAKACRRWMTPPQRKLFLESLARPGVPDFAPELPFIELSWLSAYTVMMFLEQKWKHVEPDAFRSLGR